MESIEYCHQLRICTRQMPIVSSAIIGTDAQHDGRFMQKTEVVADEIERDQAEMSSWSGSTRQMSMWLGGST